ncbi:MAG: glycosyltransferase family 4 protein [bacterium]
MNKKNILIFSTAYYPFVAGAEVAIKEITDRLTTDYEFDLITAKMAKNLADFERVGNVNVYRIGSGRPMLDKLLLPFRGALQVLKLQKEKKYHCFWAVMVTFGSGAAYIANILSVLNNRGKVPIVLNLQEGDSEEHLKFKWGGLIAFSWWIALKNTDFLTVLSSFLLQRAKSFCYNGKALIVPNGVDTAHFSHLFSEEEKKVVAERLQKKEHDIFLVTASRLVKKNAVDDIISALVYLPRNIFLIVIGKGEEGCRLQAQAVRLGVDKRVKFLGFIPHDEMPKYFSVCDIFVRPSRSEGFGNSFIEAMAARLPVIATPVGGITDFLDDKETGIFCSPNNPKSLAETVMFLLENESLEAKIVGGAYERVISTYDWSLIAQKMKNEVFEKI